MKQPLQISCGRTALQTLNTAGIVKLQQCVIQQGMERAVLAGELPVKGFSGNVQPITQIGNGNLLKLLIFHHIQQTLFQLPLDWTDCSVLQYLYIPFPHFLFSIPYFYLFARTVVTFV